MAQLKSHVPQPLQILGNWEGILKGWFTLWEMVWQFLKKLTIELLYDAVMQFHFW